MSSIANNRKRTAGLLAAVALLLVAVVMSLGGNFSFPSANASPPVSAKPDRLGNMNPGEHPEAPKLPRNTLTPDGARGSCWPSNTFNYTGAEADAVTYLEGKDARDTKATYKVVVERDEAWLSANRDYYQYTPGQTDADWHKGLVLKQLTYPITVMDTYCPDGQMNIRQWEVQTLQVGEWVYFLKGHAPGDGTNIVPVRKANCGNFLLPPPKRTTTPPVTHKPPTHKPPRKTHKPPKCKHNCTPPPKECVKPPYPGQGWKYNAETCTYYKPPQTKDCMLNGGRNCPPNGGHQAVGDNTTSGKNTGKTPGAPLTEPAKSPTGTTPQEGTKAPDPTDHGTDSGAADGSGTPGGTTSDSSGTTGGGSTSGSGSTDSTHSGDQAGTDGQTSTGGGDISNPFG